MKSIYIYLFLLTGLVLACEPSIDELQTASGDANFSKFVTIGDSYVAGFADGELYKSGQTASVSNMVALQLQTTGTGGFNQPLMLDELGFGQKKVLGYKTDCEGAVSLAPIPAGGVPDPGNFASIAAQGPFQNLGVPGTKSFHMVTPVYSNPIFGNPYYVRFASAPGTSTLVGDAVAQNPTFFLLGAGTYDVLRYAMAGGVQDSITPAGTFQLAMTGVVQMLIQSGAKGALLNVPDIIGMPYFTTIGQKLPYNGFVLTAEQAAQLNGAYLQIEQFLASIGIVYDYPFTFVEGPNGFVVQDADIPLPPPLNVRQMTAEDLFLLNLPTDSILCYGWCVPTLQGPNGIPQRYVLKKSKIEEINAAVEAYNVIIKNLCVTYNLAEIDVNGLFKDMEAGMVFEGMQFNSTFVSGGFYSLDGLHLSNRGNAILANYIIEKLNAYYGSVIPMVNVGDFPGIIYP